MSQKNSSASRRLRKELATLSTDPPTGICLEENQTDNLLICHLSLNGPPETLYDGEKFRLQFKFGSKYPFDPPIVQFVGEMIPIHPHVYSNGHICLSILSEDWSPALSIQSVCLSILSMLSSGKDKKPPADDKLYVKNCSNNPKNTRWFYHDDEV